MASTPPRSRAAVNPLQRLPVFVLPLVIAVVQFQGTRFAALQQPHRSALDALGFALLLAGPVALLARRRYPVLVLAVVLTVTVADYALNYPYGPVFLSAVLALIDTLRSHRVVAWAGAAAAYVGVLVAQALPGGSPPAGLPEATGVAAWMLVVLLLGEGLRVRGERRAEALRSAEDRERRKVSEERLRIARELHDVLAHNISLINVQASVALHLLDQQPDAARGALSTIKTASKEVLAEMRSVLGVLRGVDEEAPRLPAPSLSRLDELVARIGDAGLRLDTEVHGDPVPLPAGVDVAAYRILQEALTNAARHGAKDARARARITYDPAELVIEVDNQLAAHTFGTAPSDQGEDGDAGAGGSGNGIIGMRERVSALGGRFSAGPVTGTGRFRVLAGLPLHTPAGGTGPAASAAPADGVSAADVSDTSDTSGVADRRVEGGT